MTNTPAVVPTATELAVRDSSSQAGNTELAEVLKSGKFSVEVVTDPAEIQRQIATRLLDATSNEELENFGSATGWEKLADIPVEIHGFRWSPSTFEQGAPVFVIVDAVRLDVGEKVVLTTGAYNVLAQLCNLAMREQFPCIRKLAVSEKQTKAGYSPFWLVTPPEEQMRLAASMADQSNPLDEA